MSAADIVQNMISQLGTSQTDRTPPELEPQFFKIDPREPADLLAQARGQAALMRFYSNDPARSDGDWTSFFPQSTGAADDAALLASEDGRVPPHLGLLGTFYELFRKPQAALNDFTARHMDFQFRRVLRFVPRAAQPDHAHLVLELKKNAEPVLVTTEQSFSAGKDAKGIELLYKPVRNVVVGQGKVEALHSVHREDAGVYFAPVAKSSDGLGGELDAALPKWKGFGGSSLPAAPIGFALASPVLRMQEGVRKVSIELTLGGLSTQTKAQFAAAFRAHLTGPKGWLGPFVLDAELHDGTLTLSFDLAATDPAVVDYQAAIHAQAFSAQAPIVQLLLQPGAELRYADIEGLSLSVARIRVNVDGMQTLALENDNGSLNPKKAFQPFGPQPVVGSRFLIGSEEALGKHLTDLRVDLTWQAAPTNLVSYYADYSNKNRLSNGVTGRLVYQDRSGQTTSTTQDIMARDSSGTTRLSPSSPPVEPVQAKLERRDRQLFAFRFSGSGIARLLGLRRELAEPMRHRIHIPMLTPTPRSGFITLALEESFMHADYRKESMQHALARDGIVLNEPYTPTVQAIKLGYTAVSDGVDMSLVGDAGAESFTNLDMQFFHVGCFGQAREHAFLRAQLNYVDEKLVRLMPQYRDEGELLIGLSGASAGDSLSLLMQLADGSADPALSAQPVKWSVLCDNYWRALTPQELVLDTTNHLLASGIVAMSLPRETSTDHTWMPAGRVWLRAAIEHGSAAACQFIDVAANAVEVAFADQDNDPQHLASTLAAGSIAKLKAPQAAIKKLTQPYAGFGGRPQESDVALTQRSAERLRHRNRCITPWDYERMLLEAFPSVHKVKCIPHASETSWLAPGNVLLIAIPDLRNRNAVDPLAPRVDLDTLTRMSDYAQAHCGMGAKIKVRNPRYQRVRLDFGVRFLPGKPYNFFRNELDQALIRVLSPWAFDAEGRSGQIDFGGRLYRSVLLDFVEELPYVDFVTDFRLGLVDESGALGKDVAELAADAPDIIFVSDTHHAIAEVKDLGAP